MGSGFGAAEAQGAALLRKQPGNKRRFRRTRNLSVGLRSGINPALPRNDQLLLMAALLSDGAHSRQIIVALHSDQGEVVDVSFDRNKDLLELVQRLLEEVGLVLLEPVDRPGNGSRMHPVAGSDLNSAGAGPEFGHHAQVAGRLVVFGETFSLLYDRIGDLEAPFQVRLLKFACFVQYECILVLRFKLTRLEI
jgi:hypothetical protein